MEQVGKRAFDLIALDVDGTLLSPAGAVTDRTRRAVQLALNAGYKLCLATGRSWWESRRVIEAAGLDGPGVFVGGAIVNDMRSGRSLQRTALDSCVARQLCRVLHDHGHASMVMQDRDLADVEWLVAAELPMPPTLEPWLDTHGSTRRRQADLDTFEHPISLRVGTIADSDRVIELIALLRHRFGESIYLHEVRVPSGVTVLEIFSPVVNKWHGIRQLCPMIDVDRSRVVCVGDDFNDLQMLEAARLGVAMGNARPEVKQVADRIIGTNAEDGLAVLLEELSDSA
jgi:5-amino-6-(5-phospho-D-ribitylamino)uracil phosphatase